MSYDIYIKDPRTNKPYLRSDAVKEGGTQQIGGQATTELNMTTNYGKVFRSVGFDIKNLYGKTCKSAMPKIRNAMQKIKNQYNSGDYADHDYWAATPGNAYHALNVLYDMCEQYPKGIIIIHS